MYFADPAMAASGPTHSLPASSAPVSAAHQAVNELQPLPLERYGQVKAIVDEDIAAFAQKYFEKRVAEMDRGEGLLTKIGNDFYKKFGLQRAASATISRSYDSALGTCLQNIVIRLASLTHGVQPGAENKLQSALTGRQQRAITLMLEQGVTPALLEELADPQARVQSAEQELLSSTPKGKTDKSQCDLVLFLRIDGYVVPVVIEVKSGGMLDDKKAMAEKRGLLEYCARYHNVHGVMPQPVLAVLYDVNEGSGKEWACATVQNAFSQEELLIGRKFWNFVLNASDGYDVFMAFYWPASEQLSEMVDELERRFVVHAERLLALRAQQAEAYAFQGKSPIPIEGQELIAMLTAQGAKNRFSAPRMQPGPPVDAGEPEEEDDVAPEANPSVSG